MSSSCSFCNEIHAFLAKHNPYDRCFSQFLAAILVTLRGDINTASQYKALSAL